MISRTERWYVRYANAHCVITVSRLRKPISLKMCKPSQNHQARYPFNRSQPSRRRRSSGRSWPCCPSRGTRTPPAAGSASSARCCRPRTCLLQRDLNHARQRPAVLSGQHGRVADDIHLRITGNRQIRVDLDPAPSIDLGTDRLCERHGGNARRPQDRVRFDRLVAQLHLPLADVGHRRPGPHRHAQLFERAARERRQRLRIGRQHGRAALDQDDPRTFGIDRAKVVGQRVA